MQYGIISKLNILECIKEFGIRSHDKKNEILETYIGLYQSKTFKYFGKKILKEK